MATNTNFLEFGMSLASYAIETINEAFLQTQTTEIKSDNTPVTDIDKKINHELIIRVKAEFPEHSVLGEEESFSNTQAEYVWVCDPIDGTFPFIKGIPTSTFSLALYQNGVALLGIIAHPITQRILYATQGGGAFLTSQITSQTKPVYVSNVLLSDAQKGLYNIDWWPSAEYDLSSLYGYLSNELGGYMISPGSACFSAFMVATGEFAVSVFAGTKGKCVDMAAAALIVTEAGGKVTDMQGNNQRYNLGDINGCVLSNGVEHDKIVEFINKNIIKL
jgi:myo-inositol-1(or 4)-monophosphatase